MPSAASIDKFYENFEPPPEAPTFMPDEEEFKDPLSYIAKIKPVAERFGVVKIKPPEVSAVFSIRLVWNSHFLCHFLELATSVRYRY